MFENPEDDWLATASSRARARVEVNIKKLSADERARFRAAQDKEMDQWVSNDVISVCQRAGIAKQRVIGPDVGFTLGKWLRTQETKAKGRLVVTGLHWSRLDRNSLGVSNTQSPFETTHFTALCVA